MTISASRTTRLFQAFLLTALATASAQANVSQSEIGATALAGNGCLEGKVREYRNETTGRILLSFTDYKASSATGDLKDMRKTCTVAIPVKVAKDERIVVKNVRMFSTARLYPQAEGALKVEPFFVGQKSIPLESALKADKRAIRKTLVATENGEVKSVCGQDSIIRVNTSALVKNATGSRYNQVSVGSLALSVLTEKCESFAGIGGNVDVIGVGTSGSLTKD